jgi:hypothetical protein
MLLDFDIVIWSRNAENRLAIKLFKCTRINHKACGVSLYNWVPHDAPNVGVATFSIDSQIRFYIVSQDLATILVVDKQLFVVVVKIGGHLNFYDISLYYVRSSRDCCFTTITLLQEPDTHDADLRSFEFDYFTIIILNIIVAVKQNRNVCIRPDSIITR